MENEQSKLSTPSAISFTDQGREYGYNALKSQPKRPESTVLFIHNLLGSSDTSYFSRTFQPIDLIPNTERNSTLLQINKDSFETEEITAMILEYVKEMTEKFGEGAIKDCSITIPSFWNRAQRVAVISAANAAGFNVLALMHENTGAALYYGIDRMDNVTDHFVLFYNLGASYLQVTLAKYGVASKKPGKQIESVEILGHSGDSTLGGSLFDSIISKFLVEKFREKHGIDLTEVPKAMVRIMGQANLAKKTLSANKNTLVVLNSIYKGIDFSYSLTRDEFEALVEPYVERLVKPVLDVIEKSGIELGNVNGLEIIGGVSRVPRVQEILKKRLGLEIGTHLNGDESMAHGAAIYAANFSSVVQVKPMWLTDISSSVYSAKFLSLSDSEWKKEAVIFKEDSKLGNRKKITFGYNKDIVVVIEEVKEGINVPLCSYDIKGITDIEKEEISLFFNFVLDSSGIPFLHAADAKYERNVKKRGEDGSEEDKIEKNGENVEITQENDEKTEEKRRKTEESEENAKKNEENLEGDKENVESTEKTENTEKSDENTEKNEENTEKSEETTKNDEKALKSKKQSTISLKFQETILQEPLMLTSKDVSKIVKRLESFKESEILAKKLSEAKNGLESSIYSLSEKLEDSSFQSVTSPEDLESLQASLNDLRAWVESDEFQDSSTYEIKKRKKELESQFSDSLQREKEKETRDSAVEKAFKDLGRLEDALLKLNETKPWIPVEESLLAWSKLNDTLKWIEVRVEEQKKLKDWEPLAFKTSELEAKVANVQKSVEKLKKMTKPKPKKGSTPDFVNFGDNFDWSKVKMENVKVDGKEYNYDPEKGENVEVNEEKETKPSEGKEEL